MTSWTISSSYKQGTHSEKLRGLIKVEKRNRRSHSQSVPLSNRAHFQFCLHVKSSTSTNMYGKGSLAFAHQPQVLLILTCGFQPKRSVNMYIGLYACVITSYDWLETGISCNTVKQMITHKWHFTKLTDTLTMFRYRFPKGLNTILFYNKDRCYKNFHFSELLAYLRSFFKEVFKYKLSWT